jgi:hypothetical protein
VRHYATVFSRGCEGTAGTNAEIDANTVTRIENGADSKQSTMDKLQQALEAAGVDFIDENGGGPGVRLRKRITKRSA